MNIGHELWKAKQMINIQFGVFFITNQLYRVAEDGHLLGKMLEVPRVSSIDAEWNSGDSHKSLENALLKWSDDIQSRTARRGVRSEICPVRAKFTFVACNCSSCCVNNNQVIKLETQESNSKLHVVIFQRWVKWSLKNCVIFAKITSIISHQTVPNWFVQNATKRDIQNETVHI